MKDTPSFRPWTWARRLTAGLFLLLLVLGARGDLSWMRGSLNATRIAGTLHLTDPLVALETTLAARSWMPEMLGGAALLVLFALLFGPVFCGWFCPLGLLLDLWSGFRGVLKRLFPRPLLPDKRLPHGIKYAVLSAALTFSFFSHLPVFEALSPIHGLVRAILFGTRTVLWFLAALVLVELFAPRLWCRSLCPLGGLYSVIGARGLFRIHIDAERAGEIKCQRCEVSCPMGIEVMSAFTLNDKLSVDHPDCTRCGACTEVCPNSVLRLGFKSRTRAPLHRK